MIEIAAFFLAFIYANAGEWFFHRYVLHGMGKRRGSFFNYHCFEHHKVCIENNMLDPGYGRWPRSLNGQAREAIVLFMIVGAHLPLFFFIPGFVAGLSTSIVLYYYRHRRSHLDREWAFEHLRWHYDHHMSTDHEPANWCITWPWFDYLMGTRVRNDLP